MRQFWSERGGAVAYTGEVTVGGPAATRELADLVITKVAVGPFDNNAYLLRCRTTDDVVLVDAANEPDRLLAELGEYRLTGIVTTHRHPDHWQALPELVAATGAPVFAHPADAAALPVDMARPIGDGDTLPVGGCRLRVVHLGGHTPGSIALVHDSAHVFSGDALFPGGVGRTTSPADFQTLYAAVVTKIFDRLPDSAWVYPGHGADTTLGAERPQLDEWRERGW
jgi:glyoxylase-like metal-dependent hydrolase (beta-lactamase superfamily II)